MSRRRKNQPLIGKWGRRAILTLAFLSVGSVVGTMLYGSRLVPLTPTQADSFGYGPLGHHAFSETMKRLGLHVVQSRGDRFEGPASPMLFIEPETEARVEGKERTLADALEARAEDAKPTIVVLPKWNLFAGAAEPFVSSTFEPVKETLAAIFGRDGAMTTTSVRLVEDTDALEMSELYGVLGTYMVQVPNLQVITDVPPLATVLLESPHGAVVVAAADGTVVVSDPDLIHNYNFHRADHAALWWTLLADYESDTIVIDEVFHGHGKTHSLSRALGEFPAVLLVSHLLLLLLLLVILGSKRFGPALPPFAHGHGPREAIEVAAHVLADGQPIGPLVEEYVAQVLFDLHERLGLPQKGSLDARAAAIDEVAEHRRQAPEAMKLLRAARTTGAKSNAEGWRIARAAHTYRQRLLGRLGKSEGAHRALNDPPKEERAA
ncbi:MAG: hypothetical protein JJ863_10910 [Deltaproteobacteria bacterium]|nr:hypothetical protein [Deltaproteobacteria bacterium]